MVDQTIYAPVPDNKKFIRPYLLSGGSRIWDWGGQLAEVLVIGARHGEGPGGGYPSLSEGSAETLEFLDCCT